MPMGQLAQALREANLTTADRLLVGPQSVDAAGAVLLRQPDRVLPGSRLALVQTVHHFPPVLHDPHAPCAVPTTNALLAASPMASLPAPASVLLV